MRRLKDANAYARIVGCIRRMERGNPGDVKGVGRGIMEMRIDYGPGYRVYYVQQGPTIILLLCAGTKHTQANDVKRARDLAEQL